MKQELPSTEATILVKRDYHWNTTDIAWFSFSIKYSFKLAVLVFSFIGYRSDRARSGNQSKIDVTSSQDLSDLD